jgi:hypothetical protein
MVRMCPLKSVAWESYGSVTGDARGFARDPVWENVLMPSPCPRMFFVQ